MIFWTLPSSLTNFKLSTTLLLVYLGSLPIPRLISVPDCTSSLKVDRSHPPPPPSHCENDLGEKMITITNIPMQDWPVQVTEPSVYTLRMLCPAEPSRIPIGCASLIFIKLTSLSISLNKGPNYLHSSTPVHSNMAPYTPQSISYWSQWIAALYKNTKDHRSPPRKHSQTDSVPFLAALVCSVDTRNGI